MATIVEDIFNAVPRVVYVAPQTSMFIIDGKGGGSGGQAYGSDETDAARDKRLCSDLAEAIVFLVTVKPLMTDKPDADPVHERVDQVIQDLTMGRVIPRKVDELSTAVERTKRDQAVHRVTKCSQTSI